MPECILNKELNKISLQEIKNIFEVNFFFIVKLLLAITKPIKKEKYLIVNINSLSGLSGSKGESIYSASKHALKGFFNSLALDRITKNILIFNIYSGGIKSKMTKNRKNYNKLMSSDEAAEVIFFRTKNFKTLQIKSSILTRKFF